MKTLNVGKKTWISEVGMNMKHLNHSDLFSQNLLLLQMIPPLKLFNGRFWWMFRQKGAKSSPEGQLVQTRQSENWRETQRQKGKWQHKHQQMAYRRRKWKILRKIHPKMEHNHFNSSLWSGFISTFASRFLFPHSSKWHNDTGSVSTGEGQTSCDSEQWRCLFRESGWRWKSLFFFYCSENSLTGNLLETPRSWESD